MSHYLVNFIVYILAMVGVFFVAFVVWRNATTIKTRMSKSSMQIEDSLSLAPRKNLYIIRIKNERFLIAADAEKTTFLSKLEDNEEADFKEIQDVILNEDLSDEITSKIKLKEEEQEIQEEEKQEKQKTANILQELLHQGGIN